MRVTPCRATVQAWRQKDIVGYKKKMNDDMVQTSIHHVFALLDNVFAKTRSTDPVKVAAALEGMKIKSFSGDVEIVPALCKGLVIGMQMNVSIGVLPPGRNCCRLRDRNRRKTALGQVRLRAFPEHRGRKGL